jgi:hypothetical protein
MFEQLHSMQAGKVEQGVPVSFPLGVGVMVTCGMMLDHLYQQEVDDYTSSDYASKRPSSDKFDFVWWSRLNIRFLCRVTALLNTIYSLEGVLRQSYKHFLECLKPEYADRLPPNGGKCGLSARSREVKDYFFYRNKVFAHTSFADPRNDSKTMQYSSLAWYTGAILSLKDHFLALGGGAVIVDGQDVGRHPPEVCIVGGHTALTSHYANWEAMFINILGEIPRDELTRHLDTRRVLP